MRKYIIIALIALMIFAQGVSADTNGTGNVEASDPVITSIALSGEGVLQGNTVQPVAGECLDVVKCGVASNPLCCQGCITGGCVFNADGDIVGAATGSYCLKNPLGALPPEVLPCNMTPPADNCSSQCEYDADGMWVGPNLGGYAYDIADGYKTGLRTVNVLVNVTNLDGIHNICDGGIVKMTVDNYDMQNKREMALVPISCDGTTGTFTGSFQMHYWEKPGFYTIDVEVVTCENTHDVNSFDFEYLSQSVACIAPPGKSIDYGTLKKGSVVTANGDVIMSNCTQCDIGSAAATIRNLGNTVINLDVSSTHMTCTNWTKCSVNRIPVDDYTGTAPVHGVIEINLGNAWENLNVVSQPENLAKQTYCTEHVCYGCEGNQPCTCEDLPVYGLPPGPHATNNISLRINPVPNLPAGPYAHTLYITATPASTKCCQDHRESAWGVNNTCVTPSIPTPMCYELDNNAYYLSSLYRNTCIKSSL